MSSMTFTWALRGLLTLTGLPAHGHCGRGCFCSTVLDLALKGGLYVLRGTDSALARSVFCKGFVMYAVLLGLVGLIWMWRVWMRGRRMHNVFEAYQ